MTRLLVAALAVALFVAATVADDSHDHSSDFEKLDDRLDHLTDRIHDLNAKIDHRIDPERIKKAHSLEHRVVRLEGDGCGKREFQCGNDDPQCIGSLLVCDGVKDCRNGHDEESCELPTTAGSYFEGHVITDTCTKRRPDVISVEITSVRRDSYFQTVAYVRAIIHITYAGRAVEGEVALPTVGFYSFGSHKLILAPPEDDRLGLVCEFDGYNADKCQGKIVHEGSLETCATLLFTRRKNQD
jgi:hypothetical protein